jgi:hypothetical protein
VPDAGDVDDDGVQQHAIERSEIMIRELDPGPG